MITDLRCLWRQAFGDTEAFLDCFFLHGYAADRCRYLTAEGRLGAALYWFDCSCRGKKIAYLYAIATEESLRNQGLCRRLMEDTHNHLRSLGYAGAILVPGSKSLFSFYKKLGYITCCTVTEKIAEAGSKVAITPVSAEEYAALRREFLPEGGVLQEGPTLDFLHCFARFYAGDGFVFAASLDGDQAIIHELLGSGNLPGITAALGAKTGRFRTPGSDKPFAMYYPLSSAPMPSYFGLALD